MIVVKKLNAVFDEIVCEESEAQELDDYFTFEIPNHQFMRFKHWDGKAHLFKKAGKRQPNRLYAGLRQRLVNFCAERELQLNFEFSTHPLPFKAGDALAFAETLDLPVQTRDYQLYAFNKAIRNERQLIISPTGSGKSLIIYMIIRFLRVKRTLLIVPTLNLIQQMYNDFSSYGFDSESYCHKIYSGQDKDTTKPVIISTWQSIYTLPKEWFANVDCVIVDEVHGATAKSIRTIMENLVNTNLRFGLTGTLDELPVHRLMLEGYFGPVIQPTSTAELIEKKVLSGLKVRAITLGYSNDDRKAVSKLDYAGESLFLVKHTKRNDFIERLATTCQGTTLILTRLIEHGDDLFKRLQGKTKRPVHLINGTVNGQDREEIRQLVQYQPGAIIVASYGTLSTGVNIPSIRHIIFASPYKSKIKVLQSIGRGLRRLEGEKEECDIWDIGDDLTWKNKPNYTLRHMIERIRYYGEEGFDYKFQNIDLGGIWQQEL